MRSSLCLFIWILSFYAAVLSFCTPVPVYGQLFNAGNNQYPFTQKVYSLEKKEIELKDGLDLSNKDLRGLKISCYEGGDSTFGFPYGKLKNIKFDGANLDGAMFQGVEFVNCSFKRASLDKARVADVVFTDCDFSGATLNHKCDHKEQYKRSEYYVEMTADDIKKTLSFRENKCLCERVFPHQSFEGTDLSDFDLTQSAFWNKDSLKNCKMTDALISNSFFAKITYEQLLSTKEGKRNCFTGLIIGYCNFKGADLSRRVFIDCRFSGFMSTVPPQFCCDFEGANFTDTVISGCIFTNSVKNLTPDQIKSTWNYKVGRMEGIKLPKSIQDELDKEKENKTK
jgi:uncharacterized protein YjbI with pentapeptide repeats